MKFEFTKCMYLSRIMLLLTFLLFHATWYRSVGMVNNIEEQDDVHVSPLKRPIEPYFLY